MGDAATIAEAQNATLTTVLNQLWGENRCAVAISDAPDVDIGPTSIQKWAASYLAQAGIGVALDDPHAAATTSQHSSVQLWTTESDMKAFVAPPHPSKFRHPLISLLRPSFVRSSNQAWTTYIWRPWISGDGVITPHWLRSFTSSWWSPAVAIL